MGTWLQAQPYEPSTAEAALLLGSAVVVDATQDDAVAFTTALGDTSAGAALVMRAGVLGEGLGSLVGSGHRKLLGSGDRGYGYKGNDEEAGERDASDAGQCQRSGSRRGIAALATY